MKSVVLLDGGMGQEIVKRSGIEPTPLWSTRVMLDNPDLVQSVHEDYIRAGAKVITLNNYTATPERLARDATVDLLRPIHEAAISIAEAARKNAGVDGVRIAGCLPPLMASYKPELAPDFDQCLESYRTLAALQKDGVDMFIVETASSIQEAKTALKAGQETGLPTWVSFTLDDNASAKLRSGEKLSEALSSISEANADAVLVNCSKPETIDRSVETLVNADMPFGAYANGFTSIAGLAAGGTVNSLTAREDLGPQAYAKWGLKCVRAGMRIIGGCCETDPAHIAALRDALIDDGYSISAN